MWRWQHGKLIWLVRILDEHLPAVEADLHRYYRLDIIDLYRGKLSVRKLLSLLQGLPRGSALHVAITGEEASWSPGDYLLAATVDLLQVSNWLFMQANSKKGTRNPFPDPVQRPGRKTLQEAPDQESQRFASAQEVSAFIARATRGH
ncbi:hypothetical protein GCM10009560_78960 [Nonomuraea longicatena]|uniref:Uncharacterized protein n=1 Tax=Nonomuraea longicatena TaxID=83682 RepID=A0ABN1RCT8_9ACTN